MERLKAKVVPLLTLVAKVEPLLTLVGNSGDLDGRVVVGALDHGRARYQRERHVHLNPTKPPFSVLLVGTTARRNPTTSGVNLGARKRAFAPSVSAGGAWLRALSAQTVPRS